MDDKNTLHLVSRAVKGDKQALAQLCEERARQILYVCIKLCGSREYGQDAAQDVLLYMQTGIRRLRKPESFAIWLNRIINSSCIKVLGRERREAGAFNLDETGEIPVAEESAEFLPVEWAEQADRREFVLECIQKLTPKQQQVLLLYYYEEMSVAEIAATLRTTPGTVSNALLRAKSALKKQIESESGAVQQPSGLYAGLPVLTLIFQNDASRLVPQDRVQGLLAAAGAGSAGLFAAGLAPVAGVVGSGAVAFVSVAIGFSSSLFYSGSSSPPVAPATPLSPSSAVSLPQQPGQPEREEELIVYPQPSSSAASVNLGDGGGQGESSAVQQPQDPGHTGITARGRLVFVDENGQEATHAGLDLAGVRVSAYQSGAWVETTYTDSAGEYTLHLPDDGAAYTLSFGAAGTQLQVVSATGVSLAAGAVQAPPAYVTDAAPPACSLRMLDASGAEQSIRNPHTIEVLVSDATPCGIEWQISSETGDTPLVAGSGAYAACHTLPASDERYRITFTVTDLAGNQSVIQRLFYIV